MTYFLYGYRSYHLRSSQVLHAISFSRFSNKFKGVVFCREHTIRDDISRRQGHFAVFDSSTHTNGTLVDVLYTHHSVH